MATRCSHACLEKGQLAHLHSEIRENLEGCDLRNTYTWLLAMRSWAISTFSLPLITK